MKKKVFIPVITFVICTLVLSFMIFKMVPVESEDNSVILQGLVVDIYEAGAKDIVFKLDNDNFNYYINRGLEAGMDIDDLKDKLIGNTIEIKYHMHSRHIYKLKHNDDVLFP